MKETESVFSVKKGRAGKTGGIFGAVRWTRLRYMLIFTHAPLFANMQGCFFSYDPRILGLDAESWMRICYCLGAGFLFLFATPLNIRNYAKILSVCAACFFAAWIALTNGAEGVLLSCGFTFFYGGCGAVAAFHFSYMLNDRERFLGAVITSLFYTLFQLDFGAGFLSGLFGRTYMSGLVLVTLICMLSYRESDYREVDFEGKERGTGTPAGEQKRVALAFYFFFAYHIVEMFYTYMQGDSDARLVLVSGVGGSLVIAVSFLLYSFTRFNLWHMCHLFFLTMFMSYILLFWSGSGTWLVLSRAFHGGEQIGFIASYCILWGILREHVGFRKFKIILVCTLNLFFIVYAFLGKMVSVNQENLPILSCVVTFCLFLAFLLLSPSYAYFVFDRNKSWEKNESGGLAEGAETAEGTRWQRLQEQRMERYQLTKREKEVCCLMLEGNTMKQIAARLGISVDTAKFHGKNIYKKLGCGGKTELFAAFSRFDEP